MSRDEEFAIFDEADFLDLSDGAGNLYGLRRTAEGDLLPLGTGGEQVAKFWAPIGDQPTHGFPLWPIAKAGPENRLKTPVPRAALVTMESKGLLTQAQCQRLLKRKFA